MYRYHINCISAKGADIEKMVDSSLAINYLTFIKHVNLESILEIFPDYEKDSRNGLTIKNDYYVFFYRSKYRGNRCYYINHSSIEYIFIDD